MNEFEFEDELQASLPDITTDEYEDENEFSFQNFSIWDSDNAFIIKL